ncbi:glycosyltransferase family 2 protein [Flavobacterium ovatum]|uniref:glycosyltransferase family 2 protein n=1 Tax=Flavobacterium ovatum TaxID=1928857 RepID=UPI00345066CA
MKVSIITICYNRVATIEASILSVINQDYPNIEYIVIDGNSKDGTQAIIQKYTDEIAVYISEPDKGMYDAINKGLQLATGDVIGLMHSDDTFYDTKVVSNIAATFQKQCGIDGVYGDGIYVTNDVEERLVRNRIGGEYNFNNILKGWLPLHPTVYLRKACIEKYGVYNLDFKIASDTEFLLRYLYKHKIKMYYLNSYVVKMKMGGLSTDYKRAIAVLKEDYTIYKYHNISALKVVFQKKVQALQQYLKK